MKLKDQLKRRYTHLERLNEQLKKDEHNAYIKKIKNLVETAIAKLELKKYITNV